MEQANSLAHETEWLNGLNTQQKAAVLADSAGSTLVLAGAGTGKTLLLTHRVAHLVQSGIAPEAILLLTFSARAAQEMLERVARLTGIAAKSFTGGTFHRLGVKILRSEAVLRGEGAGLKILGAQAAASMLNECLQCHGPGAEELAHWPTVRAILTEWNMSRVLDTSFAARIRPQLSGTDEQINTCLRTLEQVVADYEHMKQRSNTYDFDDLLVQPVRLLEGNAEVLARWQGRFQHILVDEYQDTNAMQERLVALLSNRSHLTVVGDNAQSIYSWRGSDSRLIEYFPLKFDPSRTFKVETNYRSSPQIIALANRIEERMAREGMTTGPQKILQAHRADGPAPLWLRCQTPLEEAAAIANHISDWLNGGGSPGDVAILFRAHFQVHHLQLELARRAIPYRIVGASHPPLFSQPHQQVAAAQLQLLVDPQDAEAFRTIAMALPGITSKHAIRLRELLLGQLHPVAIDIGNAESTPGPDLAGLAASLTAHAVLSAVPRPARALWEEWAADTLLLAKSGLSTPADALRLLLNGWYPRFLMRNSVHGKAWTEELESLGLIAAAYADIPSFVSAFSPSLPNRLLPDTTDHPTAAQPTARVVLSSIHQAKGLEFPVVFLPGMVDGAFPLRRAIEAGALAEELRLFYVAVTRAMNQLILSSFSHPFPNATDPIAPCPFLADPAILNTINLQQSTSTSTSTSISTSTSTSGFDEWMNG